MKKLLLSFVLCASLLVRSAHAELSYDQLRAAAIVSALTSVVSFTGAGILHKKKRLRQLRNLLYGVGGVAGLAALLTGVPVAHARSSRSSLHADYLFKKAQTGDDEALVRHVRFSPAYSVKRCAHKVDALSKPIRDKVVVAIAKRMPSRLDCDNTMALLESLKGVEGPEVEVFDYKKMIEYNAKHFDKSNLDTFFKFVKSENTFLCKLASAGVAVLAKNRPEIFEKDHVKTICDELERLYMGLASQGEDREVQGNNKYVVMEHLAQAILSLTKKRAINYEDDAETVEQEMLERFDTKHLAVLLKLAGANMISPAFEYVQNSLKLALFELNKLFSNELLETMLRDSVLNTDPVQVSFAVGGVESLMYRAHELLTCENLRRVVLTLAKDKRSMDSVAYAFSTQPDISYGTSDIDLLFELAQDHPQGINAVLSLMSIFVSSKADVFEDKHLDKLVTSHFPCKDSETKVLEGFFGFLEHLFLLRKDLFDSTITTKLFDSANLYDQIDSHKFDAFYKSLFELKISKDWDSSFVARCADHECFSQLLTCDDVKKLFEESRHEKSTPEQKGLCFYVLNTLKDKRSELFEESDLAILSQEEASALPRAKSKSNEVSGAGAGAGAASDGR